MRPFWRYYGGKWRIARRYPDPQFGHIVEPFAGAAGYSCRHNARRVTLVDADPVIVGVWRYLIAATPAEIRLLPDIAPGTTVDEYGLCEEARWLVGFWMNNGAAAPCKSPSAWVEKHPDRMWNAGYRRRIAANLRKIRHWEVIHGTYRDAPDTESTWYVDPPYQGRRGSHYRHGSGGIDYAALGDWCQARKGQIIVCEAEGAKWLPFRHLVVAKTARRQRPCLELVWTRDGDTVLPFGRN